jgi:hypothetical protein
MGEKHDPQPTQETQPKGTHEKGKPAKPETIPVPTRGEVFRDLKKLTKPRPDERRSQSLIE